MTIQTKTVDYEHQGVTMQGFMAWDDSSGAARPAVAVAPAWAGRTSEECDKARELAESGYIGFTLDPYGDARTGSTVEENAALMTPLMEDRALLQGRLLAGVEAMRAQPLVDADRCAAIGFCFGGLCVLDLARIAAPLRGVVSFHGLLKPAGNIEPRQNNSSVLVLHGYDDPMAPPGEVVALADELTAAGADWQIHAFGNTMHAFTNPAANDPDFGTVYNPVTEARAKRTARDFLADVLAG